MTSSCVVPLSFERSDTLGNRFKVFWFDISKMRYPSRRSSVRAHNNHDSGTEPVLPPVAPVPLAPLCRRKSSFSGGFTNNYRWIWVLRAKSKNIRSSPRVRLMRSRLRRFPNDILLIFTKTPYLPPRVTPRHFYRHVASITTLPSEISH